MSKHMKVLVPEGWTPETVVANLDAIVGTIALGGDLQAVVRCVVDWLDGMDALADSDHDTLRRAWVAAGGTLADFPVTVVWSAIGPTAVVSPAAKEAPHA